MVALDAEEQAILESVELGEWQSVAHVDQEMERYQRYAQAQAIESISLELPAGDLQILRDVAEQSGISVPLLMAMVLHQFAASQREML